METERDRIKREVLKCFLLQAALLISGLKDLINLILCENENEDRDIMWSFINPRRNIPRIENYVDQVVGRFTREEFKANFRMSPETYEYILSIIEKGLKRRNKGKPMIPAHTQFLLTLWRLGTPDCYRSICERFNVGRSTAYYITTRVVKELVKLARNVIKWPADGTEVWAGFQSTSGFPKVIGAIDGTHINIPAPKEDPGSYVNRKGHHSIQLQAICDHKCRFTHCYIGHVGSVHDQRVFRNSDVHNYMGDPHKFPQDSHLLGDLAYKLHVNLLIPYKDNGHLTEKQRNYNFCHASARIAIERAFGLLKGRFRCLLTTLAMNTVEAIPHHILACCVLHNLCLMRQDELHIELNEETFDATANAENDDIAAAASADASYSAAAVEKRDIICHTLIMRDV